jgi:hypothetical protein
MSWSLSWPPWVEAVRVRSYYYRSVIDWRIQLPMLYVSQLRTCRVFILTQRHFQTDIIAVQRVYYGQTYNFSCESVLRCSEHSLTEFIHMYCIPLCHVLLMLGIFPDYHIILFRLDDLLGLFC